MGKRCLEAEALFEIVDFFVAARADGFFELVFEAFGGFVDAVFFGLIHLSVTLGFLSVDLILGFL